jgi:hypothetical protein
MCFIPVAFVNAQTILTEKQMPGGFDLAGAGIYVDINDAALVQKAAGLLQQDIEKVTGTIPLLINNIALSDKTIIIIGSIEKSSLIQQLIQQRKINTSSIVNKWEAFQVQSLKNPFKGITEALVITGSDRRGTAFGVFELSKQMGVSPWYWWADVPVKKKTCAAHKSKCVFHRCAQSKIPWYFYQ